MRSSATWRATSARRGRCPTLRGSPRRADALSPQGHARQQLARGRAAALFEPQQKEPIEIEPARLAQPFDGVLGRNAVQAEAVQLAAEARAEDALLVAELSEVGEGLDLFL